MMDLTIFIFLSDFSFLFHFILFWELRIRVSITSHVIVTNLSHINHGHINVVTVTQSHDHVS